MEGSADNDYDFGASAHPPQDPPVQPPPPEPVDPLGPDAEDDDDLSPAKPVELDGGHKCKVGAGKPTGTWNYTPIECVDVAWAALAASAIAELVAIANVGGV